MVSRARLQSLVADPARNRSVQHHRGEGPRRVPGAGKSAGVSGERQHRIAIAGVRLGRGGQGGGRKGGSGQGSSGQGRSEKTRQRRTGPQRTRRQQTGQQRRKRPRRRQQPTKPSHKRAAADKMAAEKAELDFAKAEAERVKAEVTKAQADAERPQKGAENKTPDAMFAPSATKFEKQLHLRSDQRADHLQPGRLYVPAAAAPRTRHKTRPQPRYLPVKREAGLPQAR